MDTNIAAAVARLREAAEKTLDAALADAVRGTDTLLPLTGADLVAALVKYGVLP